jgi:hypothetical protein
MRVSIDNAHAPDSSPRIFAHSREPWRREHGLVIQDGHRFIAKESRGPCRSIGPATKAAVAHAFAAARLDATIVTKRAPLGGTPYG